VIFLSEKKPSQFYPKANESKFSRVNNAHWKYLHIYYRWHEIVPRAYIQFYSNATWTSRWCGMTDISITRPKWEFQTTQSQRVLAGILKTNMNNYILLPSPNEMAYEE